MSTYKDKSTTEPDWDYVDLGPLSGRKDVDQKALRRFRDAIRSQGNERGPDGKPQRQIAISQMLARARANAAISNQGYRLLCQIAEVCRGAWRYSVEPYDTIGFFTATTHKQSVSRKIIDIEDLGFIFGIDVPVVGGGYRVRRFYTVVCTSSDRAGTSQNDLNRAAKQRAFDVQEERASGQLATILARGPVNMKFTGEARGPVNMTLTCEQPDVGRPVNMTLTGGQPDVDQSLHFTVDRNVDLDCAPPPEPAAGGDGDDGILDFDFTGPEPVRPVQHGSGKPPTPTPPMPKGDGPKKPGKTGRRKYASLTAADLDRLKLVARDWIAEQGGPEKGYTPEWHHWRAKAFHDHPSTHKRFEDLPGWERAVRTWLNTPEYLPGAYKFRAWQESLHGRGGGRPGQVNVASVVSQYVRLDDDEIGGDA